MHPLARFALAAGVLCSAGCKKSDAAITTTDAGAAALVGATTPTLGTGIGQARSIEGIAAPTSTRWQRAFVLEGKRAILGGESPAEADAILTDDEGRSFRTLRGDKRDWVAWNVAADGSVVYATGTREQAKVKGSADRPVDGAELRFAPFDASVLGEPATVLPLDGKLATARVRADALSPAIFSRELGAFTVDAGKAGGFLSIWAAPPGGSVPDRVALPKGERALPLAFGRPPALVTVKGGALLARAWSPTGDALDAPKPVGPFGGAYAELASAAPCDADEWTFQRVGAGGPRGTLVGISAQKTVAIAVPQPIAKDARVGCTRERVAVETIDPKTKGLQIVTCEVAGACTTPVNSPFRPWAEPHEQEVFVAPTDKGVVAVLSEHDGARWGIYATQSIDGGKTFELARVVGEGVGDRGKLEVAALVDFGKRVLLLFTGDVAGTSRRGFYAIVTDDGGTTWGPP
jgi:hypothetical protein